MNVRSGARFAVNVPVFTTTHGVCDMKELIELFVEKFGRFPLGYVHDELLSWATREIITLRQQIAESEARIAEQVEFEDYDPGLLNDWGGGNVAWWMEYIRTEIERANDHWREQLESLPLYTHTQPAVPEGWKLVPIARCSPTTTEGGRRR
jgi:hypothetical protein